MQSAITRNAFESYQQTTKVYNLKVTFVQSEGESLAIEYLSSILKSHEHKTSLAFDPRLFDSSSLQNSYLMKTFDTKMELVKEIKRMKPDLIGFSVYTGNYQWALSMARLIKRELDVPVIFGGVHPTLVPETVIRGECVDMLCVGEGEYALLELVGDLEQGRVNYETKNIWFKKEGKVIRNDVRPPLKNLDDLPFPDKDLYYECQPFNGIYMIMASRGCSFACTFCCNFCLRSIYGQKGRHVRRRSVKNVIDELIWMKTKFKAKYVDFPDDVFTSDIKWLEEFSKEYRSTVDLPFSCITHPALVNRKAIELLKRAGCYWLMIGVQSASESNRRSILNRFETNEQIRRVAEECHRVRLHFSCDHIFNIPFESEKEQIEALKFCNEIRPSIINTYWLQYYPKTEILRKAREAGILNDATIAEINEGKMSTSQVVGIGAHDDFNPERKFYNFAFLLNLLPLLPKWVVGKIVEKRWFMRWFKSPIWLNTLIKFVVRLRIGQSHIYFSEMKGLMYNMLRNWRLRKKYSRANKGPRK